MAQVAPDSFFCGLPPAVTRGHSYRSSKKCKFKTYAFELGLVKLEIGKLIQDCSLVFKRELGIWPSEYRTQRQKSGGI